MMYASMDDQDYHIVENRHESEREIAPAAQEQYVADQDNSQEEVMQDDSESIESDTERDMVPEQDDMRNVALVPLDGNAGNLFDLVQQLNDFAVA